jgi:hypothetical protein
MTTNQETTMTTMELIETNCDGGVIIDSGDPEVGYFWSPDEDDAEAEDFFACSPRVVRVLGDGRGNGWVCAETGQPLRDVV